MGPLLRLAPPEQDQPSPGFVACQEALPLLRIQRLDQLHNFALRLYIRLDVALGRAQGSVAGENLNVPDRTGVAGEDLNVPDRTPILK